MKDHHEVDYGDYENLDANKVLTAYGKYGRYQMRAYIIANTVHLMYAVNMMIMPFISEPPEFHCQIDQPPRTHWRYKKLDECTIVDGNNWTVPCTLIPGASYQYEDKSTSLAAEFDLVCDDKGSVEHGASMFLLGGMIVAPIIMQLSDLYGRRPAYLYPLYASIAANLMCALAPNYFFFLAARFISGIAHTAFCTIGTTLSLESVSVKFRSFLPILYNFFWVTGYLLAGLLKLYISDWRWLYFAASVPGILLLPAFPLLPESLHWLITKKKFDEVKKYIDAASKYNKKNLDLSACQTLYSSEHSNEEVNRTILDIFTNPSLFFSFLVNGYVFIVMSFVYWALSLFSTDLADDKMTGFFLSGVIEIPGAIIANIMIHFFERKTVSIVAQLIQCASMIAVLFSPADSAYAIFFPLLCKCFAVVMWSNHPLHCSESVPTSVRNVFIGLVGFLRDLGGVLAPYLKRVAAMDHRAPTILIAVMCLTSACTVTTLPETRDKELPEDLEDIDPGPVLRRCLRRQKSEDSTLVEEKSED